MINALSEHRILPIDNPSVLILGEGVTALGVQRVLRRRGISTVNISQNSRLISSSRWYRAATSVPSGQVELASVLSQLDLATALLLPCSDYWIKAVAQLPLALSERFRSLLAEYKILELFLNKASFAELLKREAIPSPATLLPDARGEWDAESIITGTGVFIKPQDSQSFFARYRTKAFFPTTAEDLRQKLDQFNREGFAVVFQEYIPGPASNHYFIDGYISQGQEAAAMFVRRRLRMYPRDFGNSTFMISVPKEEVEMAVGNLRKLFRATGFWGIFSAEFKWDARDNTFKILEINVRPWWYVEFAARCGVDVCYLAYQETRGFSVPNIERYITGATLVYPYYDWFARRFQQRGNEVKSFSHWLREIFYAHNPFFSWDDPQPAIKSTFDFLWRQGDRALRKNS